MSLWFGKEPQMGLEVGGEREGGQWVMGQSQTAPGSMCPLPPIPTPHPHPQTGSPLVIPTKTNTGRAEARLPWTSAGLMGPICPGGGVRGLRNLMESASPALSIRAAASRNKQNKHPRLGQAGKGRLTHSHELHPLPPCFVWRFKTVGAGARPCLTTILLPQCSPSTALSDGCLFFFIGAWEEGGWMGMGDQSSSPHETVWSEAGQTLAKSPSCGLT